MRIHLRHHRQVLYMTPTEKQLLKFKGEKDVYYLKYKELPVYVIAAVISVEDKNFYKHSGVITKESQELR